MARRLAAAPDLHAVAAEQYLPVIEAVEDPAERRQVSGLLQRAAAQAALIGDYALVDALLAAALPLTSPDETAVLTGMRTARHAALFGLGRLEEADEEYRAIEELCPAALDRADATVVQVRSLAHRSRLAEAFGLALASLRELGITVPAGQLPADLDRQFGYLYLVAGPDRRRRGPGPARGRRAGAAGRVPAHRRSHLGGLLRRGSRHGCLAGPGAGADLARAWRGSCPARPGGQRRHRRCVAARGLRRRVPGHATAPDGGRGPRVRA